MFTHVLWDCDGCLIDSEVIACREAAAFYAHLGFEISTEDYMARFMGMTSDAIALEIAAEMGDDFLSRIDWVAKQHARNEALRNELKPVAGIYDALAATAHLPRAIASGSSLERLKLTLGITKLWQEFAPHVYSGEQVPNGKPAPDIWLFAAEKIGATPATTLVIEDGVHGTVGAKAAGMTVFGFVGASHGSAAWGEKLTEAGADLVFDDMRQLAGLMNERKMYA